ncbi:MAG: tRNA lysidine(34) synthetase TilS [Gemmatimonadota bacterium]|nr:MAG: tRNA lysidine(34) synthetase TilS [Gemmatimonadota bacterium]
MKDEERGRAEGIPAEALPQRLDAYLGASRLLPGEAAVTVALSGGVDSVVLLHLLLELQGAWGWRVSAAHFDHRMREGSLREAEWVRRLCQRLGIEHRIGSAHHRPSNEADARDLRYAFLIEALDELGGGLLATAHQADDQAETVLFRLRRGSGLAGLAGIPERRPPGIVRPLLPFWRQEIEAFAQSRGLDYLADPSNLDLSFARNRIRRQLIPAIEAGGLPDLRLQLHRLAGLARRATVAVEPLIEKALHELIAEADERRIVVARSGLLAYDSNVQAHLLRALAARLGQRPGRTGTCLALEFIRTGSSGRGINLAGGIELSREFDRLIVGRRRSAEQPADSELVVETVGGGEAKVRIGGVDWRVRWGPAAAMPVDGQAETAWLDPSELHLPLRVRSWRPGDRIRLAAGTRKLKKVFGELKVGRSERSGLPLLVDEKGVLWVVGLLRGTKARDDASGGSFGVRFASER